MRSPQFQHNRQLLAPARPDGGSIRLPFLPSRTPLLPLQTSFLPLLLPLPFPLLPSQTSFLPLPLPLLPPLPGLLPLPLPLHRALSLPHYSLASYMIRALIVHKISIRARSDTEIVNLRLYSAPSYQASTRYAEVLAAPILTPTTASLSTAFTSNPHIMPSSMPLYPWCSRLQRRYHPAVFPHPAATSVAPAAHKCQPSATNATRPCHISDRLPPSSRRMMEFMADIHEAAGGDDSVKAIELWFENPSISSLHYPTTLSYHQRPYQQRAELIAVDMCEFLMDTETAAVTA
ncbi:hypothetical protein CY34DRAFT_14570 [Suillus luteus UH-Slu-Lm8-n1]|uniref:Uncharacterized protein n=1 Tax=Suillus luteus UH-Slu-Lm8-n1 TaxID=930992 RepID=A0A0C9ZND3_9AGAM|nr:hypothetical protein CY34DRAFT_14570 [Suillus luteus UH-Slu-Lm8-n1]